MSQADRVVYGTHFFPVHLAVALLVGWFVGGCLRHRIMAWVWVLPLVVLLGLFAKNTSVLSFPPASLMLPQSRISHFFGSACKFEDHCLDQVLVTLPLYSAGAYSLGALLAMRRRGVPRCIRFVKTLSKSRVAVVIGLPLWCLLIATSWGDVSRLGLVGTGRAKIGYLLFTLVESVVATLLAVVGISLIGRPSFLAGSENVGPDPKQG